LTDPDVLADYTTKFFGPNGPHPLNQQQQQQQQRPVPQQQVQGQAQRVAQQPRQQVQAPQRPQMPVPPQPQAAATPGDFWNNFGNAADRDPQNAWKYLSAAQQNPEIFRQKLLVME
jgi:hypothetical protein